MKLHRFFTTESIPSQGEFRISSPVLFNQLKNVLRFKKSDRITLFNNSGFDFIASIEDYEDDSVLFSILEKHENNIRPERETYLFASIVKKDTYEWIVQKATELGVSHIVPIISERTEKKDINKERLQKIIVEAAEQSGRGTLPLLYDVMNLGKALETYGHISSVAWDPWASKFSSKDVETSIGAYIGPEGGWSTDEIDLFRVHGIPVRSLGPQVLRTETAVVAVISRLVF